MRLDDFNASQHNAIDKHGTTDVVEQNALTNKFPVKIPKYFFIKFICFYSS